VWRFDLARESFESAGDLGSLLLLLLAQGDRDGLAKLAATARTSLSSSQRSQTDIFLAEEKGQNNLAFATLLQLGDKKGCVDLLVNTQRVPEAALFARTYAPRYVL
jgi:coatomer subunit beta'